MEIRKSFCAAFLFLQERNINNLRAIFSPSDSRNLGLLMIIKAIFEVLFSAVIQSELVPARDVITRNKNIGSIVENSHLIRRKLCAN